MKTLIAFYSQSGQTKKYAQLIAEKMGTGIWGYTMANPVISFIRAMDFTGKKMSAFWTFYDHDEKVNGDMKDVLKGAEYVDGLPLPRSLTESREKTDKAVNQWIKTL